MGLDWEAELHNIIKLDRIFSPKRDPEKEARCSLSLLNVNYTDSHSRLARSHLYATP